MATTDTHIPSWMRLLARFGCTGKGLVYLVVGVLTALVVVDDRTMITTKVEALQVVLRQPLGFGMLWLLVVGLAGYVIWRIVQGVLDPAGHGWSFKGMLTRLGYLVNGLWYGTLALTGVELLTGSPVRTGLNSGNNWVSWLLSEAFGRVLVAVGGLVMVGIGLLSARRAYTGSFRADLSYNDLGRHAQHLILVVGQVGTAARALTYVLIGVFFVRAAIVVKPHLAQGMAAVFDALTAPPLGRVDLVLIAGGLAVYGLYQLLEARYRMIAGHTL